MVEGDDATALAAWRAGKVKVELELPRVLKSAGELERARDAAARLARALDGGAPGAIKSGTSAVDLAANIAGVGAAQLHHLDERTLRARSAELEHAATRALSSAERARLQGLRVLEPDGAERPFLPEWAEPRDARLVPRGMFSTRAVLEKLESLDADALGPRQLQELRALAEGELPFPAPQGARADIAARAQALLSQRTR